jgi:CheY-like chemotaxis protein
VLVVDDDPDFREILTKLLEHEGYEVRTSASGVGAIRHLASKNPPCVVVLDLRMPRMDGWALLRVMNALGLSGSIPVVVVSAYLDERPVPKDSVAAALTKPIDPSRVLRVVSDVCAA